MKNEKIRQNAQARRILNLRIKAVLNKLINFNGYSFIKIDKIKIDEWSLNDYWNKQYNEIRQEVKKC
jgi:hypothetical protein